MDALASASHSVRVELTRWALRQSSLCDPVSIGHKTRRNHYPVISFKGWLAWLLHRHGLLRSQDTFIELRDVLGVVGRPWFRLLRDLQQTIEPLRTLARAFGEPNSTPQSTSPIWNALELAALNRGPNPEAEQLALGLYRYMATANVLPDRLRLGGQEIRLGEALLVTESDDRAKLARAAGHPALDVTGPALQRYRKAGARDLRERLELDWSPISSPSSFGEFFFEIEIDPSWERKPPPLVQLANLGLRLGENRLPITGGTWLDEDVLLVDAQTLRADRGSVIQHATNILIEKGYVRPPAGVDLWSGASLRARRHVAEGQTLPARLLRAVGDVTGPLLHELVPGLRTECEEVSDEQISRLFLATHGPDALRLLDVTLRSQGLEPPSRWTGTGAALAFVRDLGFPDEFSGGSSRSRRSPWEEIRAFRVKPLHDYQNEVLGELEQLFSSTEARRRAIVSLPTGAGKTRVVVQALVEHVLSRDGNPLVLWVAQQDELCEQAVQCFLQVWSSLGPERELLRVRRLWGGFGSGPADDTADGAQVVVATIQTLNQQRLGDELDWLRSPDAVVVDEAHRAITPIYTGLLHWLNSMDGADPSPFVGLTATPYRGFNREETERLSARFDNRLIPSAGQHRDLYDKLRESGVLATVSQEPLESPHEFMFSVSELDELERFRFRRFPDSAARRLGEEAERNRLIVDRICELPRAERVLLFACSVEHAKLIAGLLSLRGRSSAAIVGDTRRGLRRRFIDDFLHGDLSVLTNYGVLTTGFDAPRVDTIVIARPTFSPALYQQMIGRGLRGPKNGGKAHCRLINVVDNLERFGKHQAFHHFVDLWNEEADTQ